MKRSIAPIIGLLSVLAPALAHGQTNLDQGKSASQIFASTCAECHKAAHGLSHGKNVSALTDFLREHYTTNQDQAAALASYVLGGSGANPIGAAAQGRGQKPKTQQASTEEGKPTKPLPRAAAKPEDGKPNAKPANAKLRRAPHEAAKPKEEPAVSEPPSIVAPEPGPAARSATIKRNGRKDTKAMSAEPEAAHSPPVAAEPAPAETEAPAAAPSPGPSPSPSTEAPANAASGEPGEDAPVPRDHIPD